MSWPQMHQSEDLYDQITILVGSAIRLLSGDAGIFVVSKSAFDPQSNTEYTLYRLDESAAQPLLSCIEATSQPDAQCHLRVSPLPITLVEQLGVCDEDLELSGYTNVITERPALECCSLQISD